MKVSIIIPVLNEAGHIKDMLESLSLYREQDHEVIVADGGSVDDTVALSKDLADHVVESEQGRAAQMNAGIDVASGDALLFLHADTRLPVNALDQVVQSLQEGHYWGRFSVRLTGHHWVFRIIERMMNLRSCITGVATGDQCIFISRECIDIVGAYSEMPLMEDIELSKRLRTLGWPACIKTHAITSSRRWEQHGIMRTVLLMWRLRLLYFLGVSADKLARQYS